MAFESDKIYDALNVSNITDLLDTEDGVLGLFDELVIPEEFKSPKTINFYFSGPLNGSLEYDLYTYIINCRAKTSGESREIAEAVFNELNRADYVNYHTNCSVIDTIPPEDETDVFNTPVSVILKTRG